jgi:hypothetical protein
LRLNPKAIDRHERWEDMKMDVKGFVVPLGGGSVLSMAPGRSAALKLLGGETGDSIMLFEETAPSRERSGCYKLSRENLQSAH